MIDRGIVKNKYRLIPGSGVNVDYFSLLPYPESSTMHFAFISRIMKEKGIEQYLEAAVFIRRKYPNTVFHVCGYCEDNYKKTLEKLERDGIIVWHGCVRDVREIHKVSSCTIHPTYYPEGLSNVLLESLACGRPIITTDRSGCKEVVDDGINGFITRQRDSDDLIKQIEKFIHLPNDKRREMGINGRKKVVECFDKKIVVNEYLKAISIIGEKE